MYPEPGDIYPESPPPTLPGDGERRRSHDRAPAVRVGDAWSVLRRAVRSLGTIVFALILGTFGVLVIGNLARRMFVGDMNVTDWLLGAPFSLGIALAVILGAWRMLRGVFTGGAHRAGTGTKQATGSTDSSNDGPPGA